MKGLILASVALSALLGLPGLSAAQNGGLPPNDTGVNVRDRDAGAVTADQQSNAQGDREMTRQIRRAVERENSVSTIGHNVKIMSDNGVVTLRGPVKTVQEKAIIVAKAREVAGANNVRDELEVENHQ